MGGRSPLLVIVFSLTVLCIDLGISDGFSMIRYQEIERRAPMEFKQWLRDPFHRLSSCCSWEGIYRSSDVIELLHLRNRHSSDVSYMDCFENDFDAGCGYRWAPHGFRGRGPDRLGNLSALHRFDLSYDFYHIGNLGWISHLTSLWHLDMNPVPLRDVSEWLQALNALSRIRSG
ncbi:LRR receptor-like serine threonine-protein kinase [Musa troglodytarum]|uniref:LRR receptor-like serine threonine-protein kinase n=1 Tax=Musa troglodytarum TaxID=320322 RepID=A0A9E7GI43_9LILI|nr:LRR receptor-like serine threonine-protein kinase [Musa troglodytarum]